MEYTVAGIHEMHSAYQLYCMLKMERRNHQCLGEVLAHMGALSVSPLWHRLNKPLELHW